MNVAIYTRESGTRKYKPASPRATYSPDTTFCLRYTHGGKRKWEQLDAKTYKQAQKESPKKQVELITESCKREPDVGTVISRKLNLPAPRPKPEPKPVLKPGELMLDAAIDKYIENVASKSPKTSGGYRYTLQQFYASSGNSLLANVTMQHLYDFVGYLRREGLGDRTIHNRVGEVVTFLRHFGIKDVTMRVKYVEQKVRAYRPDELKALFKSAHPEEWILFQFYLCTRAREQEVMYAEWTDVDCRGQPVHGQGEGKLEAQGLRGARDPPARLPRCRAKEEDACDQGQPHLSQELPGRSGSRISKHGCISFSARVLCAACS